MPYPTVLRKSPVVPLLVHVRINNAPVLSALIKETKRLGERGMNTLMLAMERLNSYDEDDVRVGEGGARFLIFRGGDFFFSLSFASLRVQPRPHSIYPRCRYGTSCSAAAGWTFRATSSPALSTPTLASPRWSSTLTRAHRPLSWRASPPYDGSCAGGRLCVRLCGRPHCLLAAAYP